MKAGVLLAAAILQPSTAVVASVGNVPDASLVIAGAIGKPLNLSSAELAAMPHVTVTRIDHGNQVTCNGVPIAMILQRAGLPSGEALRGAALTTVLIAAGRDGYKVALTLGELDTSLGNAGAVVADRCGDQPIPPAVGPLRLILPKDNRPARSVRQLERLTVLQGL